MPLAPLTFGYKIGPASNIKDAAKFAETQQPKPSLVITKLTLDDFKREFLNEAVANSHRAFTRSYLTLNPQTYQKFIIPMIEINSDISLKDEEIRENYKSKIVTDLKFAQHLRARGPIYLKISQKAKPKDIAEVIRKVLPSISWEPIFFIEVEMVSSKELRRFHYKDFDDKIPSSWSWWNEICKELDYNPHIEAALVFPSDPPDNSQEVLRWLGETIGMIILPNECFISNASNFPVLSKINQEFIHLFMQLCRPYVIFTPSDLTSNTTTQYTDYIRFREKFLRGNVHSIDQDQVRIPLQPLKDDLDYETYSTFETDKAKYNLYQKAIEAALVDMKSEEEIVIMIVGAGQGPLVRAALNASVNTNQKIRVIIVEKNLNVICVLEAMMKELWTKFDTKIELIMGDMRDAKIGCSVDILVSELLGSFGDNELSPECLDGIQQYLKPSGISIPCNSISYLRPITAKRTNSNIKRYFPGRGSAAFNSSWLVYMASVYFIDGPKECFEFVHPNREEPIDNKREKTLEFKTEVECLLTGFAGYFTSKLYKDIEISIHPETHTQGMASWYSIYFPLPTPITLSKDEKIEVKFHRKLDDEKVWYEYQMISPHQDEVVNKNGVHHPIYSK